MAALCERRAEAVFLEEDLAIMALLDGLSCSGESARRFRLIPFPKLRPALGIGSTCEARDAADALRDEIGDIAIDLGRLARVDQ
jgi:hypothetical protein